MDVIHTAIWVSDLDEIREFYIDGLGLEHTWDFVGDDGVTNFYVAGDDGGEIQFKHDGGDRAIDPAGIDHIAVTIDDVDSMVERLTGEFDGTLTQGPMTVDAAGARVAFVEGPDGYVVELVQSLD